VLLNSYVVARTKICLNPSFLLFHNNLSRLVTTISASVCIYLRKYAPRYHIYLHLAYSRVLQFTPLFVYTLPTLFNIITLQIGAGISKIDDIPYAEVLLTRCYRYNSELLEIEANVLQFIPEDLDLVRGLTFCFFWFI
jgi:hypothetical protein